MSNETLVYAVLALLIIALCGFVIGVYNQMQRFANVIPEAMSNISVLLKKRADLITKLVSIVDSYGIHESAISGRVSGDFGAPGHSPSGSAMVERLSSLRMAFPELKADRLYGALIAELAQVESDIANRREQYNSAVRSYNTTLAQFPNNVLMRPFGFQREQFLSDQDLDIPRRPS